MTLLFKRLIKNRMAMHNLRLMQQKFTVKMVLVKLILDL